MNRAGHCPENSQQGSGCVDDISICDWHETRIIQISKGEEGLFSGETTRFWNLCVFRFVINKIKVNN